MTGLVRQSALLPEYIEPGCVRIGSQRGSRATAWNHVRDLADGDGSLSEPLGGFTDFAGSHPPRASSRHPPGVPLAGLLSHLLEIHRAVLLAYSIKLALVPFLDHLADKGRQATAQRRQPLHLGNIVRAGALVGVEILVTPVKTHRDRAVADLVGNDARFAAQVFVALHLVPLRYCRVENGSEHRNDVSVSDPTVRRSQRVGYEHDQDG